MQEGHTASVADILHLEKRWQRLPGSSTGAVALEHAVGLLGDEVLAVSVGCCRLLRAVAEDEHTHSV